MMRRVSELPEIIEGAHTKALAAGRKYGVVVLAERTAELMKEELKDDPSIIVKHDEHNHLRLGEVLLTMVIARKQQKRATNADATLSHVTFGYELRCADPITFDRDYAQQLPWGAIQFLLQIGERNWGHPGAMITVQEGKVITISFNKIFNTQTGKTDVRLVNIKSDERAAAHSTMTRLKPSDLDRPQRLKRLARVARNCPECVPERYEDVVVIYARPPG